MAQRVTLLTASDIATQHFVAVRLQFRNQVLGAAVARVGAILFERQAEHQDRRIGRGNAFLIDFEIIAPIFWLKRKSANFRLQSS